LSRRLSRPNNNNDDDDDDDDDNNSNKKEDNSLLLIQRALFTHVLASNDVKTAVTAVTIVMLHFTRLVYLYLLFSIHIGFMACQTLCGHEKHKWMLRLVDEGQGGGDDYKLREPGEGI
jgi:hypothetical protein